MAGGYFLGLKIAFIGIFFGFQACLFFHLGMSGEIEKVRLGFLAFVLLASFVFVMGHLNYSFSLLVAVLPMIFLGIFYLKDKTVEKQIDTRMEEDRIKKWKETIEVDPKNVGAYIELGDIYRKRGEFDKAISYYRDALSFYKSYSLEFKLKRVCAEKEARGIKDD